MLIDWFTVIAQVINFLILVWLLKRLLYRPILDAIDAREKRIAAELADADAKKSEARKERDEFQQKNAEFDKQRNAYLNQAIDEANAERQRLLETARQESDDLRAKRQQALLNEQRSLHEALTHQAKDEVFAIARKALTDLAGTSLEQRMTEIFIRRLRELNKEEMVDLKSAFAVSPSTLLVRTVFDLPVEQCAAIETAIKQALGEQKQIQFETAPGLVSGIEISTDGQKIAWSISEYLATLATSVDSLLQSQIHTQVKADVINQGANE
jgi:F-type H+-transporting ATPase subunit b